MDSNLRRFLGRMRSGDAFAGVKAAIALGGVTPETRYVAICRRSDGRVRWEAKGKNRVTTVGLNKILDATFKTGLASPLWYVGLAGSSISDAAVTTGTPNLTSASNPWLVGDSGRSIIVRGAGASGADFLGTFTYVGAGAVTLSGNAGTTVTAAKALWEARLTDTMAAHSPWSTITAISNANRPAWTAGVIAAGSVSNSGSPAVFTVNADNTIVGGAFLVDDNTVGGTTGTLYGMAPWNSGGFRQAYSGDTITVTATLTMTAT